MAQKQINVNLAFTANTEAAKQSLQQLQQQLQQIATKPVSVGEKLTPQLQAASRAAAELQAHLSNATNVKTGNLDFGKLTQSIKQSGMSLSEYGAKLQNIGPQGQQAFMSLAQSVAMAEVPMRRAGTALTGMLTTLKNTAKWQLSSSLLHGFISSVSSAYNYAQDLNESLNNIRIVTGYNIDQMSKFAAEANKAARTLSTTTTEYTNASLIYYQQGLSDADVKARTDVTIKMANASRQSAEIVSDQLTAIWNNFDNGTKSLEYYADVITALGAATASSSEEISDGLEKFAAVAETVGLSYEYATAALATVTATTRQSADVVGTAFKTLFARLNDLKLGETLDDGTTLGQYTENLAKIGVNIKDTSGQLKGMDQILTETAAKWDQLGRDQQVALAKGVAGIRQYSQFIALMDNWDFMEENLRTVESSGGTLQKQADIYAESWEAAQDRVRAAAEKVYSSLLNDKFFIDLTNGFGDLIDTVGRFIDSIGGLGGVLSTFGLILTKVFATQMADGFRNLVYNIKMSTDAGKYAVQQAKELEMTKLAGMMAKSDASTAAEQQTKQVYQQELILQKELIANAHNMTEAEQQTYQTLLEQHRVMGQQSIELQKQIELLKDQASDISIKTIGTGMLKGNDFKTMSNVFQTLDKSSGVFEKIKLKMSDMTAKGKLSTQEIKALKAEISGLGKGGEKIVTDLADKFNLLKAGGDDAKLAMTEIAAALSKIKQENIQSVLKASGLKKGSAEYKQLAKDLEMYSVKIGSAKAKEDQLSVTNETLKQTFKELQKDLQASGVKVQDWAANLSTMMSSLMSVGMLMSSISGLMNTLKDPDASGWEKFGQVLTSVSMIAMSLTGVFKGISATVQFMTQVTNKETLAKIANTLASYLQERQSAKTQKKKVKEAISTKANAEAIEEETKEIVKNEAVKKATGKDGLSTGTFTKGKRAGQTWYKQGGQFISADKYASLQGAGSAGGSLLNPGTMSTLMGALGSAALVAGGIAVVAGAITLAVAQYNSYETAAKNAAEAEKMLNEELNQTKEEYSQFTSLQTGYEDAINKTKKLTKGTAEYNEALLNANEQAMQLIEKYDLMGQYHFENGVIVFNEGALEEAQQKQLEKLANAQANSYMGGIATSEAQGKANRIEVARELDTKSDNGSNIGNIAATTGTGLAAGALIGTAILPGIGAAIGGAIGLIGGSITQAVVGAKSEAELDAFDKLTQYVQQNGSDIFAARSEAEFTKMLKDAKLEIDDKDLIKSLYANRDAIKELTLAEVARLEKEQAQWEAGFSAYNMANQQYTDLAVGQGYLNEQSSNYRDTELERVRNEVNQMFSGSNDDFWAKYLEMVYGQENIDIDNTQGENVRVKDLGGVGATLQKLNAEGVWETVGEKDGLSETAAAEQLVNAILLKEASEKMDFEKLQKLTEDLESAGLTLEKDAALMDDSLSQFGDNGTIDFSNFTASEVLNIDTSKILDANFRKAMEKAVNDYEKNMTEVQRKILDSDWYKGLTPDEQSLVWQLEVDSVSSIEDLERQLDLLQGVADGRVINYKLKAADQLEALITADTKDWEAIWDAYAKVLRGDTNATGKDLTDQEKLEFASLSEEEMLARIQGKTEQNAMDMYGFVETTVTTATNVLADTEERLRVLQGEDGKGGLIADAQNTVDTDTSAALTNDKWLQSIPMLQGPNAEMPTFDTNYWKNVWSMYEGGTTKLSPEMADIVNILANGGNFNDYLGTSAGKNNYILQNAYERWADTIDGIPDSYIDYINGLGKYSKKHSFDSVMKDNMGAIWDPYSQSWAGTGVSLMNYHISEAYDGEYGYKDKYRPKTADDLEQYTAERDALLAAQSSQQADAIAANVQLHDYKDWIEGQYKSLGLDIDEINKQAASVQNMAGTVEILSKDLKDSAFGAKEATKEMMRFGKSVTAVSNNYDKWNKVLTTGDLSDQMAIIQDLQNTYGDLLDIDASTLSTEFLFNITNLNDMKLAIEGNIEAYNRLQVAAASALYIDKLGALPETIATTLSEIANLDDIKIGEKISVETEAGQKLATLYTSLVNQAIAGGYEVTEAIAFANNIMAAEGFNAPVIDDEWVEQEITVKGQLPPGVEPQDGMTITGPNGESITGYEWISKESGTYQYKTTVLTPKPLSFTKASENLGGGSTFEKTKKVKPAENKKYSSLKKKSDIFERYKEWDDALDDVADAMEDVNKQADRLYGANRINALRKQNELLKQQRELLKSKKADAETNLTSDKNSLLNIASKHGVNFEFDDKGNITNYTAEMTKLFEELHKVEEYWAKASNFSNSQAQSDYEKNKVQPIRDKIDEIKDALGIYTNTRELIEDLQNQIDDAFYEWQDNNYEQLHYKLEVELEINDMEMRMLDYYLNKISDDFYSMAEAAQLMVDKIPTITSALESYAGFKENLDAAYAAGDISQEAYVDGLKQSYDGILNNLEALQELDKEMLNYYENTLSAAMDELAQYTDHMEHLTGVLEHYHNIITMINGEEDFESIGTILEGKSQTLKNEMDVAQANYEMLKREQAAIQASYDSAVDENAREGFARELKAINAQVDEAHETLLSKTEEWAEVQKAIMENVMKEAAHAMEQAFTNGLGFDALSNSIDRLSSLSNEYLTKTNQIYETQKLINTAQQASDKTTNNAAKIRLKNFQDEIAALQEKNKLTKLDLDIAKAKYDVLLAEIALEEAQNAKATVRLQRDNEGNYGYVYTADQQKVAEAEQKLADTQNALYNVRLEAANNYGQKIMELNQKLYDDMAALEQAYIVDSTISEEEYNQQKEMLLREYYDLYEVYSHNYTAAMEEDAAIQTDAWVTAYEDIINSADQWQQHINIYSQACEDAYQHYRSVVEAESEIINDLLGDVAGAVKDVTTESDALKNKVLGEVIPSLETQLGAVRDVTDAYFNQRTEIFNLMKQYEDLANAIKAAMEAEAMRTDAQAGPPEDFGGTEPDDVPVEGPGNPTESRAERVQRLIKEVNAGDVSLSPNGWAPDARYKGYSEEEIALARQAFTQSRETLKTSDPAAYAASVYNYDYYAALEIASRFKSGGYTGAWGPEGRMAILDEKELVLNAHDTENFLMATGILRSIADVIDINSLHNQISQLSSVGMTAADRGMLEQQVSIEAHFPNVSDRNEIEEAFNNLINTASQYANRKF